MGKRKAPTIFVAITAFIGVALAAMPFGWGLRVRFARLQSIYIAKTRVHGISIPFLGWGLSAPDPTWERAIVPCEKIEVNNEGFFCTDMKLGVGWMENTIWDLSGRSSISWMPYLRTTPFKVHGENIVFSSEYK